ncbi:Oxidoreductase, short chain dehydrogenase/reductase family [Giardia muris]|uniref:Oxidoreductase, short chain dehydrogenase/reductase family n=1 Tax=Giardia muris TaxID=5742 RepID=A0A4Z1SSH8_GIAMU|nr:Oxidoreductase, short chain dehydrogenase/reductase family [Giardia muris]|eukprot:TNJ28866.1 Oxidoreductase, short chain dehydrogenase/reductase family [Giardia muris]
MSSNNALLLCLIPIFILLLHVFVAPALSRVSLPAARRRLDHYKRGVSGVDSSFALITGATGAIGGAFARYLAKHGFNLMLVGRSEEKLQRVREGLLTEVPTVEVLTHVCDLTDSESVLECARRMREIPVSILINNAGTVNVLPDDLSDQSPEAVETILRTNVIGTTQLTHALLPQLKARKNCLIVFMGSITGIHSTPMISVYASTKAYTISFGKCLRDELRPSCIDVVVATPAWIASEMTLTNRTSTFIISGDRFVKAFFRASWAKPTVNPYYWHGVMERVMGLLPKRVLGCVQYKQMVTARGRIARKLKRSQEKTE